MIILKSSLLDGIFRQMARNHKLEGVQISFFRPRTRDTRTVFYSNISGMNALLSDFGSKIISGGNDVTDKKILALGNFVKTENGSFYEVEKYFSYDLKDFLSETGIANQIYLISGEDLKYAYHMLNFICMYFSSDTRNDRFNLSRPIDINGNSESYAS